MKKEENQVVWYEKCADVLNSQMTIVKHYIETLNLPKKEKEMYTALWEHILWQTRNRPHEEVYVYLTDVDDIQPGLSFRHYEFTCILQQLKDRGLVQLILGNNPKSEHYCPYKVTLNLIT